MPQVHFNPRVKVRTDNVDMASEGLNDEEVVALNVTSLAGGAGLPALPALPDTLQADATGVVAGAGTIIAFAVLAGLAVLATWIAGLVRMAHCGGAKTPYFLATLLLFLLLPGPGSFAAFVMAIVALAMLKPGKSAFGMTCPAK